MSLMVMYSRKLTRLLWGEAIAQEDFLEQLFSHFRDHQNTPKALLKQSAGPYPTVADAVHLGWGPRVCISD